MLFQQLFQLVDGKVQEAEGLGLLELLSLGLDLGFLDGMGLASLVIVLVLV